MITSIWKILDKERVRRHNKFPKNYCQKVAQINPIIVMIRKVLNVKILRI
jgi:hypothetical protein